MRRIRIGCVLARIRQHGAQLAAAVAGLLVVAWPLLQGRLYAQLDHAIQFIPARVVQANAAASGEWGLWAQHFFRGYSLLALGEAGSLHPWRLLCAHWPDLYSAIAADMLVALPLVWGGTLVLARHYRYRWGVAILGANLHAFSAFYMAHFGHTHMITIMAHSPWAVLCVEWAMRPRTRWRGVAGMGLLVASMCLLGHPHTTWFVALLVAIALLHRGYRLRGGRAYRVGLAWIVSASLAGLAIGVLQLLPTWELLRHHPRGDLSVDELGNYSAHPVHLLQNLAPGLYPQPPGDWYRVPDEAPTFMVNPTTGAVYVGLGLLVLLAAGMWLERRRLWSPGERPVLLGFLALAGLLVLMMMGRHGGVMHLLWEFPVLDNFRTPHRYKAVLAPLLIAMACWLLQQLVARPRRLTRGDHLALAAICLPALAVAALPLLRDGLSLGDRALPFRGGLWLLWGPAVALATAALVAGLGTRRRGWMLAALGVVCLADLAGYGLPIVRDVPYKSRAELLAFQTAMEPQYRPFRMQTDDYGAIWRGPWLVEGFAGLIPLEPLDIRRLPDARLANIGEVERDGRVAFLPGALPRLRLVPTLQLGPMPIDSDWDPAALATMRAADSPAYEAARTGPPITDAETVLSIYDGFDRLEMTATVVHDRILVVGDRYDPDWRVTVDGRPGTILPLYDRAMRGVVVAPGSHVVEMRYRPRSLQRAAPVAIAGGLSLFVLTFFAFRRRRLTDART